MDFLMYINSTSKKLKSKKLRKCQFTPNYAREFQKVGVGLLMWFVMIHLSYNFPRYLQYILLLPAGGDYVRDSIDDSGCFVVTCGPCPAVLCMTCV